MRNSGVLNQQSDGTIVIAEDSRTQRQQLSLLLEDAGFEVIAAEDGLAAIELVRQHRPDLVVSDVMMPGCDGYTLCRTLKNDPDTEHTPVILVTELSRAEDVFKGLNCGADNFITKPYDERYLLARIQYIFTNRVLRESGRLQVGVEIELQGKRHFITADRQQILDLLISTYGEAVHLNGELRENQEILKATLASLNAVTSVTEALNRSTTQEQVLEEALTRAIQIAEADTGWFWMRAGDADSTELVHIGPDLVPTDPQPLLGGPESCPYSTTSAWSDLSGTTYCPECGFVHAMSGGASSGHLLIPLQSEQHVLGVLNVTWHQESWPEQTLLRLLTAVGQQVGVALERANLHHTLERKVAKRTAALTAEIEQRQAAESSLVRRRAEQAALAALGQDALAKTDTDELFQRAVELVVDTLDIDAAALLLRQLDGSLAAVAAAGPLSATAAGMSIEAGIGSFAEFIMAADGPVAVADWAVESRFRTPESVRAIAAVSSLSARVRDDGGPVGLILAHAASRRPFEPAEVSFMSAIASTLSSAKTRTRTLRRLRASEAEFRATFEQAAVGFAHTDLEGRFLRTNRRLAEKLGYEDPHELDGVALTSVMRADSAGLEARGTHMLLSGQLDVFRREARLVRKNGTPLWAYLTTSVKQNDNCEPEYFINVIQDITAQKRSEEQITHLQKLEAVGRLTGSIAHDFNNLLMVVIGNLELLDEGVDAADGSKEMIEAALGAATRGANLTRQLLTMSRRHPLEPKVIDMNELVRTVARLLERTIGSNVDIKLEPADDLWPCRVDPSQLETAVTNLALNARDAMPNGGSLRLITSNVQHDEEFDTLHPGLGSGDYVCLAVSDTGTGIPEEHLSLIFEPYFTTKEEGKGTGLGLSTVYGFVRQSGGDMTVYSEVDVGTTFRIYLPYDDGQASEWSKPEEVVLTMTNVRAERALVVDDEPNVRDVLVRQLNEFGFSVTAVASAEEALGVLETASFDVLVTDYSLGKGMNGDGLVQECAKRWPSMVRIVCSGLPQVAVEKGAGSLSHSEFLLKPVTKKVLGAALQRLLGGVRDGAESSSRP